jgi:HSP20 family protein
MRDLVRRKRRDNSLTPWDDFDSAFERLRREINDLFDWSYAPEDHGLLDRGFAPTVDMVENPDDVQITCDLPGVDKNDIDISISDSVLTIKGEKKGQDEKKDSRVYRKENWYGSFQRTITLPGTVDQNKVDAEMKNGVLTITLPKKEEAKQKQISVNVK